MQYLGVQRGYSSTLLLTTLVVRRVQLFCKNLLELICRSSVPTNWLLYLTYVVSATLLALDYSSRAHQQIGMSVLSRMTTRHSEHFSTCLPVRSSSIRNGGVDGVWLYVLLLLPVERQKTIVRRPSYTYHRKYGYQTTTTTKRRDDEGRRERREIQRRRIQPTIHTLSPPKNQ